MTSETTVAITELAKAQREFDSAPSPATALAQQWSQELVQFLAAGVLGFSVLALLMATLLLWRSAAPPQQVLRVIGVISILGFSALLLVAGYSNDQLTPIVGLFGAISGYLLGKDSKSTKDE